MDSDFGMRRWAVVALAIVAAVVIGGVAYQAGVSQGLALQPPPAVAAPAAPDGAQAAPAPYYRYRYYEPWRFGFGFMGPVISILLFVFVIRAISWGLFGWGWRRRWWYHDYPDYGPSRFDDWHRRAHERMRDDRSPAPPSA
jgi:hypothetical protein